MDPKKLIEAEFDRCINEVLMDATPLEKAVVRKTTLEVALFINLLNLGYPAKVWRMVFEVCHKYYCICEGLEKK